MGERSGVDEAAERAFEQGAAVGAAVAGLDGAHSRLLRLLAGRDTWTRAELEQRCADLKLLPDGAIDRLNEAAYDTAGDPLVEGEDPLDINTEVAQEMLA